MEVFLRYVLELFQLYKLIYSMYAYIYILLLIISLCFIFLGQAVNISQSKLTNQRWLIHAVVKNNNLLSS